MATVEVSGVELFYESRGSGDSLVLTHGSWTDGSGWEPSVALLAERYRVVSWDRRGHSRSQDGAGPGSRAEDASDLAGLIEHLDDGPVHLAGSSYGAIVTLTVVTDRPELVATAAVHEPPLFGLLEGADDEGLAAAMSMSVAEIEVVANLIGSGDHRAAAEHFVEHIALGPGAWETLPEPVRTVFETNAPTFLDELADPTALSVDADALARTNVPLLLTHGTESPALYPAVIEALTALVPEAQVALLQGAGHIPHATHPVDWAAELTAFHDRYA